jgi:hypothetical protein
MLTHNFKNKDLLFIVNNIKQIDINNIQDFSVKILLGQIYSAMAASPNEKTIERCISSLMEYINKNSEKILIIKAVIEKLKHNKIKCQKNMHI